MHKFAHSLLRATVAGLLVLLCASCSPNARKARHLAKADQYFNTGDYPKAEIEYLNVLQLDRLNPEAIGRLGLIYSDEGRTDRSIAYIKKGHELQPENLDLRLKFGQLSLATGQVGEARDQAGYILSHRPQDPEAPLLLATALTGPGDIEKARALLLALPPPASQGAPVLAALGLLELREGHLKEAAATLKQAQAADPKFASTFSVLGTLELAQKDPVAAGQAFKQAAELSPLRSPRRLQYALFKLRSDDPAGARQSLEEMTKQTPDYLPAWLALAETALIGKKYEECAGLIANVFTRDAENLEARLLRGRLFTAQGENAKAVAEFTKLTDAYPKLPAAHFELGRAYAAAGESAKAIASLNQAVSLAPGMADAVLLLAELNLQKGDFSAVIVALKPRLQQHPELTQAWLLLALAYRGQGNLDDALAIYRQLETRLPGNPQPVLLRGQVLMQQRKTAEARQAFTHALELSPDSPVALEQLVDLDLMEKNFPAARARVEQQMAGRPPLAGYGQLLFAKIFLAQDDAPQAEAALKKVIEIMPDSQNAYFLLARLYASTKQEQKALASLTQAVARNPKDIRSLMLIGMINDQLKSYAAARDAYEKVLVLNPRHVVALNNLAYLDSEHLDRPDQARELAQKARELLPNDPNVADTLGWILYKQRNFPRALSLLLESANRLPESAEIQFHLGMARYMMGQEDAARRALAQALDRKKDFPGADVAQSCLDVLATDPGAAGAATMLEQVVAKRPGDPVALVHLAAVYELAGKPDLAMKAYQDAMRANPANDGPILGQANLYLAKGELPKAIELAKSARKLAPDDPETAQTLGRLAYRSGEYQWATSLLQEAFQDKPDSPDLVLDLAQAFYSVGRVDDAQSALRNALNPAAPGKIFLRSEEARRLSDLIAAAANPAEALKHSAEAEALLKTDPENVPALMVLGACKEQQTDPDEAIKIYQQAVNHFPDFAPAKLRLAILWAESKTGFDQQIFDWALQARSIYPSNAELAKALGLLTYRKGDYAAATTLLRESTLTRDDDASLWYYLGMAQLKGKGSTAWRQSLQKSLDLGLAGDSATEARKILISPK